MLRNKRIIIFVIIVFTFLFVFSNSNTVNAESIKKETIEYSKEINKKDLENIKKSKLSVWATPHIKLQADPSQVDVSKYYYNQLKTDISRNTYNALVAGTTNQVTITFNNVSHTFENPTDEEKANWFDVNVFPYIIDGYEAYIMDGTKNYWWTSDVSLRNVAVTTYTNGRVDYTSAEIFSNMTEWQNKDSFNSKLSQIASEITGNTIYEKVKSINYYISKNVEYETIDNTEIEQTAYGALILNKAVCEGQAQLFNLLCKEKGIECINVFGYIGENSTDIAHAWNYVYEPTKKMWYAVDVTWNNYYKTNAFIMVGNDTIIEGEKFSQNHFPGFKQYQIQTYTPATPTLATDRYVDDITVDGNYIKNIQPNTTFINFKKEFAEDLSFTVLDGENEVTGNEKIKTGQKFIVGNTTFILVVIGDTNSDGNTDIKDIMQVNKHRLNKSLLENENFKAGDVNKDGVVDLKDIMQINKYRLNKLNEL